MIEQAIRQGDATIAPGSHMSQSDSGRLGALDSVGEENSSDRRITADSFRLLIAKLKKPPVAAPVMTQVPQTVPVPPTPPPIEVIMVADAAPPEIAPVEAAPEERAFPVFGLDDVEPAAVEPEIELAAQDDVPEPVVVEEPVPLADEEPAPVEMEEPEIVVAATLPLEPEPIPEAVEVAPEEVPEEPLIVEAVAVIPEPEPRVAAQATAMSKARRVEIEGIGDIARSIYMTPTSADRTAFLAECAAMAAVEAEAEQARDVGPAIIYSEPYPTPKATIRRVEAVDDPFARIDLDDHAGGIKIIETDDDAGELARSLLDMMLSSPSAGLPQERALAADALLKLVPRIPLRSLVAIVERVSVMESPPHLLVTKLINDPRIEVAGPLLELCNHISDQVLTKVIATGQVSLLRLIARRRHISAALSDQLIQFDDTSVILTLVRNNGVTISHPAFSLLADHARRNPAVLAPLATRADLPAPIAFELFWFVPAELRRYLLSRFLTDSETLAKILKITQTMQSGENTSEPKFAERDDIEAFVTLLIDGKLPEAAEKLAEIGGIHLESALRIVSDREGEPLTIMFKAMGTNRARFSEIVELLKGSDFGIIRGDRDSDELKNVFDSMSFNKARVLLTYWDWAVLKSGPYAPAN